MRSIIGVVMTISLFIVVGCAGLEVKPVPPRAGDSDPDNDARGFRYYRSAPFLLVYTDNKGGLITKVLNLPDMTKKMSVKPYNYLASNDTTLTFDKGLLTQAKAVVDETAIPAAVVSSLEKVATALVKAANAPSDSQKLEVPAPYLFRIVKYKDTNGNWHWKLAGGQGKDAKGKEVFIRVTAGK